MHSSGHESHGVHVCSKCGWPFPKPQPSSRHRRSHRKICGTIEGYKLIDSQDTAAFSDEDHLSDEDHRTPSPRAAEKIDSEKHGDGVTGERSNKSEDELFSDAVTEFTDTGFNPGTKEPLEAARPAESKGEKITARNLTIFYSFKDNANADVIELPGNSTDSSPMPNPEVHENNGDAVAATMSSGVLTTGIESVEHMDFIDTVPMNVNAKQEIDFASSVNSIKGSGKAEGNDNLHDLSVPADVPVVHHSEIKLDDGFNYCKGQGVKLNNSIDADSLHIKKDDDGYPVPKASASDLDVFEDNMRMVEKQSTEQESDVPQIKLTSNKKSDELGTPVASVIIETEESLTVSSVGKQPPYVCDDSLHKDFPDTAVNVLNDVNPMTAEDANAIDLNDAGNHKKGIRETNNGAEIIVNSTTDLHESDDAGDHEKGKIENSAVVGVEREDEPAEEVLSLKTKPSSECATSLHKFEVIADDVIDMTAMKLPETKFGNLDRISDTHDGTEQLEIGGNDKAQEKGVAECDTGAELSERTSDDRATEVPPFGTESSIQSSVAVAVADNHTGEFGRGDSATNLLLQGENIDNNFVKHQLGASPVDISVDSSFSQTDSLEANWGSISVLSTQSDAPVVDAETLPSEMEKSNMKAKGAIEGGQHSSSKSDIFEAPSFLTLVEPGGDKAAASQTQTMQNPHQQAGWFPSLTNVMNESKGRKKNEEIIAKVTNWSTGKQHTPLKNLLGEAKHEARPKENQARDETVSKDNGDAATTVSSILGPEDTKTEMSKEGRYPADIKRERRKVKGRPYWAQFMCCSSVN